MSNEIGGNLQANNYYDTLKNAGLSSNQLSRLDTLNGTPNDKVINEDVFTIANSILKATPLSDEIGQNQALVQEVMDIMHGDIDISQLKKEYQETPRSGIDPETLMNSLHLSEDQADKLMALSKELTGNENTVDRSIASAVICVVRGQQAPNGIPEDINNRILEILGGNQQVENQFGV